MTDAIGYRSMPRLSHVLIVLSCYLAVLALLLYPVADALGALG